MAGCSPPPTLLRCRAPEGFRGLFFLLEPSRVPSRPSAPDRPGSPRDRRCGPEVGEVTQRASIPPLTCPLTTSERPAATLPLPPFSRLREWAGRPLALGLLSAGDWGRRGGDFVVTDVCPGVLQVGDAGVVTVQCGIRP